MSLTLTLGTESVTLRNPDLGNTLAIDLRHINKEDLTLVHKPEEWPGKNINFSMNFQLLDTDKKADLSAFLSSTIGKEVTLIDHLGNTYTVIITNPDPSFINEHGTDLYSVTLEMVGKDYDYFIMFGVFNSATKSYIR